MVLFIFCKLTNKNILIISFKIVARSDNSNISIHFIHINKIYTRSDITLQHVIISVDVITSTSLYTLTTHTNNAK